MVLGKVHLRPGAEAQLSISDATREGFKESQLISSRVPEMVSHGGASQARSYRKVVPELKGKFPRGVNPGLNAGWG